MNAAATPPLSPETLVDRQRVVQRKLGRCLLRLQQYEMLLKAVVANTDIAGPPEQLQALRDERVASAQTKTLGTLVGVLTESYLTLDGSDETTDDGPQSNGGLWFRFRAHMSLDVERHGTIKASLKELVDLRNELVHHFLVRFDIWQADGCTAADAFLDESYETIDGHYLTLHAWAQGMDEARTLMASFMKTPAFRDMVIDGIQPDGAVHWPGCGIVCSLREAEVELAQDGWTPLHSAIEWVGQHAPDQTPRRYGCGSWRHVIHESKQFEVRKRSQAANGSAVVWYRSRPEGNQMQCGQTL
jgi:hypothetical protein